jgi:hypothetical protein
VQVGDQHSDGLYLGLPGTLPTVTSCKAPEHRHADGAHDRNKQSRVVVSLDDESLCKGRHFE